MAESNPAVFEDSHSFIKYQYAWTVNSDKRGADILFFIEGLNISAEFHPVLSWVRPTQADDDLLKHEQGHFDLAEMVKRENMGHLQNNLYDKQFPTRGQNEEQRKQFAKEDSTKLVAQEIEKLEIILSKRRQEYDVLTNYGQNRKKQSEYDSTFQKLRL
ncbi:MAG: hypothetical protein ACR2LL_10740 [Nitrosopumilus sp.]|uniref:hypothetical protein n=1 Tax=Nitrosopumilus sp. TaxID=2024843 RepID=UPI00292CFCDC|nr:hypothetical protein [Nitrosopumilus sp.]